MLVLVNAAWLAFTVFSLFFLIFSGRTPMLRESRVRVQSDARAQTDRDRVFPGFHRFVVPPIFCISGTLHRFQAQNATLAGFGYETCRLQNADTVQKLFGLSFSCSVRACVYLFYVLEVRQCLQLRFNFAMLFFHFLEKPIFDTLLSRGPLPCISGKVEPNCPCSIIKRGEGQEMRDSNMDRAGKACPEYVVVRSIVWIWCITTFSMHFMSLIFIH